MYCIRVDNPSIKLTNTEQKRIQNTWRSFTNWRKISENATLCRMVSKNNNVVSVTHDITYKDVVGLRWQQTLKGKAVPFQVISVIAIVYTQDNQLVLLEKDSGDWPHSLECSGGFVRASYMEKDPFSLDSFVKNRVIQDFNIPIEIIQTCDYVENYDAKHILESMFIYKINLTLTASELEKMNSTVVIMPAEYDTRKHLFFSKIPLHEPSMSVLNIFQR